MPSFLEKNLAALLLKDPSLTHKIQTAEPHDAFFLTTSRSGHPLPSFSHRAGEAPRPLHSSFDPVKEAQRGVSLTSSEGFVILLGLGGGYHITAFQKEPSVTGLLVIERDLSWLHSLFTSIDLSSLFTDPRFSLLVDASPDEIERHLFHHYRPALDGGIATYPLRARVALHTSYFREVQKGITSALHTISCDYSTQAHFGKRWFHNSLVNVDFFLLHSQPRLAPTKRALVTAAGPSLEEGIPILRQLRSSGTLIATDTSVPTLIACGLSPDLIVSIDCQSISALHFLEGYPSSIPLILDLASPPTLSRLAKKRFFFASGHPLSRYIHSSLLPLPLLDTSGGNVTHTAFSLARALTSHEIVLFGVDLSYPLGKTYARGSYLFPRFAGMSSRLHPQEELFFRFLMRGDSLPREPMAEGFRYKSASMERYRERLEEAISLSPVSVRVVGSSPLRVSPRSGRGTSPRPPLVCGSPLKTKQAFFADFLAEIRQLPDYLASWEYTSLPLSQKQVVLSLLPTAATFQREGRGDREAFMQSRQWCASCLVRHLNGSS